MSFASPSVLWSYVPIHVKPVPLLTVIQVFPQPKILNYHFWLNTTSFDDEKSIFPVAAYFSSQLPRLNRLGLQGYYYIRPNAIAADFYIPNEFANATHINAFMDPVLNHMKNMTGMNPASLIKIPPMDMASVLSGISKGGQGPQTATPRDKMPSMMIKRHGPMDKEKNSIYGGILDQDSLLMGEEELTNPKLAEAFEKAQRHGDTSAFRGHLAGGGKVIATSGNDTSVTPVWRRTYVHMMATGNDKVYLKAVRDISPNGGAYINEVS